MYQALDMIVEVARAESSPRPGLGCSSLISSMLLSWRTAAASFER